MKTFGVIIASLIFTSLNSFAQMSDEAYLKSEVPDIDESRVKIEALRAEEERLKANRFKDADGSKAYNKARSTREAL